MAYYYPLVISCLYYCKDTLFEAIHNPPPPPSPVLAVVCITAKIHFLKQFTTVWRLLPYTWGLFVLLQRYTFWSNSQPLFGLYIAPHSCLYYCKDTLFEAIHNGVRNVNVPLSVVCITAKIHFLKQFTTIKCINDFTFGCLYYCKDTLFEAIHNTYPTDFVSANVVCITAKIHFLKQFTTADDSFTYKASLFVLLQRYTFWSNSQPLFINKELYFGCLYYCKDTLFEAIHNLWWLCKDW